MSIGTTDPATSSGTGTAADPTPRGLESVSWVGRRVLVTGGSGFIGAALVGRLVALGAQVHTTTRGTAPPGDAVQWWRCELSDPEATASLVHQVRPEIVLHLAGRAQGARAPELAVPMVDDNLRAVVAVLRAAVATGYPRVVLAGSLEEPRTPDDVAVSPYAAAKAAATAQARLFHHQWELPVSVLRVAMAYGPGQPDTTKLVPYVIDSLLRGQTPRLSSGTRRVDWVYIDDVVEAFLTAATHPDAPGHVLDIGAGRPVSITDTVTRIAELIGTGVELGFGQAGDRARDLDRVADPEPAATVLGWRARTPLTEGLQRTINAHRDQHARPKDP